MDLLTKLTEDMKIAMKSGQKDRLQVIRMLLSDVKNIDLMPNKPTAEQVVAAYAKKLQKGVEEYEKLGKPDEAAKFKSEIAIVEEYLPKKASGADTEKLMDEFLAKNAFTEKDFGRAMGAFMKAHGSAVDAGQANQLLKKETSREMTEPATSAEANKESGTGASPVQTDILRLAICPNCDYSLESLPPEGICPECGRPYDQKFVILTSADRGTLATALRWMPWIAIVVIVFIPAIAHGGLLRGNLMMIGYGLAVLLIAGTQAYARLFSSRKQRQQLWMSADGVAQIASTPEGRFAATFARYGIVPIGTITMAFIWMSHPQPLALLAMELGFILIANLAVLFQWRNSREMLGENGVPTLRPWTNVESIEIDELLNGHHRVKLKKFGTYWVSHNAAKFVDIELPFDGRQIAQFQTRVESWTDGRLRCTVNDRPSVKE